MKIEDLEIDFHKATDVLSCPCDSHHRHPGMCVPHFEDCGSAAYWGFSHATRIHPISRTTCPLFQISFQMPRVTSFLLWLLECCTQHFDTEMLAANPGLALYKLQNYLSHEQTIIHKFNFIDHRDKAQFPGFTGQIGWSWYLLKSQNIFNVCHWFFSPPFPNFYLFQQKRNRKMLLQVLWSSGNLFEIRPFIFKQ